MNEQKEVQWKIDFHKALSNPVRLEIVDLLSKGELCQCEIFPQIGSSQSTISAYLTQLVRVGILRFRKDGTRKLYSLSDKKINTILEKIHKLSVEKVS